MKKRVRCWLVIIKHTQRARARVLLLVRLPDVADSAAVPEVLWATKKIQFPIKPFVVIRRSKWPNQNLKFSQIWQKNFFPFLRNLLWGVFLSFKLIYFSRNYWRSWLISIKLLLIIEMGHFDPICPFRGGMTHKRLKYQDCVQQYSWLGLNKITGFYCVFVWILKTLWHCSVYTVTVQCFGTVQYKWQKKTRCSSLTQLPKQQPIFGWLYIQ